MLVLQGKQKTLSVMLSFVPLQAGDDVKGAVLASDAFFPFSWGDSVEIACQAGVVAIAHPGGSMRDQDAIDCCNKYGVVLMTTKHRHFKH
jgi:phosphoribosylaminoimidazolecarboxamide formyltransferase / IMP cyclohydrolase